MLLDNANLCNPSVLDRLNPLLEPHGVLYLNECGTGVHGPRIIKPHPNFRLFLAMDPRHGEVSRAMRNRGIELYLAPQASIRSKESSLQALAVHQEFMSVLGLEGIPGLALTGSMARVHAEVSSFGLERHG